MKKTKFLALASLILAAGLVGCGGGNNPSVEPSQETPSVEEPGEVTYETTPALALSFEFSAEPDANGKIKQELPAGEHVLGDFTCKNSADGKVVLETENKTVTVNGESKTYDRRVNNKSSNNMFNFTTEKAGKFVFVARSSGKETTATRTGIVFSDTFEETVALPGGTGDKNADFTAYEVILPEAGEYSFQIIDGASHILDLLVYYAA